MIPLRDENPALAAPIVTRTLIALNVAAFAYELMLGPGLREFVAQWGLVPARLTLALRFGEEPLLAPLATTVTSMFLHGGFAHLLGNLWYLWIFGDNVEDRLGHLRYFAFYLVAGLCAVAFHYWSAPSSTVPTIGASGAIAGVLGAYLAAFPRARVVTLVPLFPFLQILAMPATLVLGLWFVFQFLSGAMALASMAAGPGGGVAWWAHIGGFAFGFVAMKLMDLLRPAPRAWAGVESRRPVD